MATTTPTTPAPAKKSTKFQPGNKANPRGCRKDGTAHGKGRVFFLTIEERKALAQGAGITPLQFLMSVVCDDKEKMQHRIEAAKSAAPYFHRKQPIGVDDGAGGAIKGLHFDLAALSKLNDDELDKAIALAEKLGALAATTATPSAPARAAIAAAVAASEAEDEASSSDGRQ